MVHLFASDDESYRAWMAKFRRGYVLVSPNPPVDDRTTVHRSDCPCIALSKFKGKDLTYTHVKVCSETLEGINRWADVEFGEDHAPLYFCKMCLKAGRL